MQNRLHSFNANLDAKNKVIKDKSFHLCVAWLSPLICFHRPLHNPEQSNENGVITFAESHKPVCTTPALVQGSVLPATHQLKSTE